MGAVGADGLITFFYYDDLERAVKFYSEVMGLELVTDQGWAKIFRVAGEAYVGLVDGHRGFHKASPMKPVMLTIVTSNVDAWYERFLEFGVETFSEPKDDAELGTRMFMLEDPEGYVIEIQKFY
jgi:predicted enzyme related to lactoylglutathione lyase